MWISFLLTTVAAELLYTDPSYKSPISISNLHINQVASYTFRLSTTVSLSQNDVFYVQLPDEYETVSITDCDFIYSNTEYDCDVTINSRLIYFNLPVAVAEEGKFRVILDGIQNPAKVMQTGPFSVYVKQQGDIRVRAQNKILTTLAFEKKLSSALVITGEVLEEYPGFQPIVQENTNYAFRLEIQRNIDANTWFQLQLPTGWSTTQPNDTNCKVEAYEDSGFEIDGNFICETSGQYVTMKGLQDNIQPDDINLSVIQLVFTNIKNPTTISNQGDYTFTIRILDEGTNRILDTYEIPSPQIIKGQTVSATFTKVNSYAQEVLGNTVLYDIAIENKHEVPIDGLIEIQLKFGSFYDTSYTGCLIVSGISSKSQTEQPICAVSGSSIRIENAGKIGADSQFVIRVPVVLSEVAVTDTVTVTTKYNSVIIDQGKFNVLHASNTLNFKRFSSIASIKPVQSGSTSDAYITQTGRIEVVFTPFDQVPLGTVTLYFPSSFTLSNASCTSTPSCSLNSDGALTGNLSVALPSSSASTIYFGTFAFPTESSNVENVYEVCIQVTSTSGISTTYNGCTIIEIKPILDAGATYLNVNPVIEENSTYTPFKLNYSYISAIDKQQVRLDVEFNTMVGTTAGYDIDLGITGTIACFQLGSDVQINCSLTKAPSQSVDNKVFLSFTGLPSVQTTVKTLMVVIKTPANTGAFPISLTLGYVENNIFKKLIVSSSYAPTFTDNNVTNATTSSFAANNRPTDVMGQSTSFAVTYQQVNQSAAGESFYVLFPAGWNISTIKTVTVGGASLNNLQLLPNDYAPAIYGELALSQIPAAANVDIFINPVTNPIPLGTGTGSPLTIINYNAATNPKTIKGTTANVSTSTHGSLSNVSITTQIDQTNYPADDYSFTFTLANYIPTNGKIKIGFPITKYTSFTNYSCGIVIPDYTGVPTCSYSDNIVTISNLPMVAGGSTLTAKVFWIANPSTSPVTGFSITTTDSSGLEIDTVTGQQVAFSGVFSSQLIQVTDLEMDPDTKNAPYADFFLNFTATNQLPKNTTIQITVPDEYARIPTSNCLINYKISSCSMSGHLITITLSENVPAKSSIKLSANGVFSVPDVSMTSAFVIKATYNGMLIDQTIQNPESVESFEPNSQAQSLTVDELQMIPSNAGEVSTYKILLNFPRDLKTTDRLIIWFPDDYDDTLTCKPQPLVCWGEPQVFVGGHLYCELEEFRKLVISGFNEIEAGLPFNVYIGGIVNPTSGILGRFRFGLEDEDENTTNYLVKVGSNWISSAPGNIRMRNLEVELPYARVLNTFTFQFTIRTDLPSLADKGAIWIDFPSDFALKNLGQSDGWDYPCTTKLLEDYEEITNWNPNITCTNYESNRIEISGGTEVEAKANRIISITIQEVRGPKYPSATEPFVIRTYDGINERVLEKTYADNNYPLRLWLPLSGEDLLANNDQLIEVRRGQCTNELYLSTTSEVHPMRVYLKVTASLPKLPEATLYPDNVLLWHVSDYQHPFRLCVPSDSVPGRYSMEWDKSGDDYSIETIGDEIYSQIGASIVQVSDDRSNVTIGEVTQLVTPGKTFPISVTLDYPPFKELYLTVRKVSDDSDTISFEPSTISFSPGETMKEFVIVSNDNSTFGNYEIGFELAGEDESAYITPSNINIEILGTDNISPVINSATYTSTRLTATITVRVSERANLYYAIELNGALEPTPSELIERYEEGLEAYRLTVRDSFQNFTFTLDRLAASTHYKLFLVAEDRSGNISPTFAIDVTTQNDYTSAKFAIDFAEYNPDSLSQEDGLEEFIKPEIAKALSVIPSRLTIYSITTVSRRSLQQNDLDLSGLSDFAVIVEVANDKYGTMVSPVEAASNLTLKILNSYLARFFLTATYITPPFPMTNVIPVWTKAGNVWAVSGTSITTAGRLSLPGYLHMVVLDQDQAEPTPQQIVWGLDGDNKASRHASAYYDGQSNLGYVTYVGLAEETKYDVYIAATSDYPGNNRAVSEISYDYKGVRTDTVCVDCDKYMVVDDFAANLIMASLLLLAFQVI